MVILTVRDEGKMTAEQLHRALMQGDTVEAMLDEGVYVYARRATYPNTDLDVFAFWGPTGTHAISVQNSDAERVFAHWRGFVQTGRSFVARSPR